MSSLPQVMFLQYADFDKESDDFLLMHLPTGTVLKAAFLAEYAASEESDDLGTYPFIFENIKGGLESHIFIVKKLYSPQVDLLPVFQDCELWYTNFLHWQEDEILRGGVSEDADDAGLF